MEEHNKYYMEVIDMKVNKIVSLMVVLLLMIVMAGCGTAKKNDNQTKDPDIKKSENDRVSDTEEIDDADVASKDAEDHKDSTEDKNSDSEKEDDKQDEDNKEDRTLAPNFTLDDGKGNEYSISDYKGKLLLVNFFTTWCTYCVEEMPHFQKIYDKYRLDDVAILGVNVITDANEMPKEDVLNWIAEKKITFPIVFFDDDEEAIKNYYINGYPTTYVIDKEGYIVGYVNALDEEMLEKK